MKILLFNAKHTSITKGEQDFKKNPSCIFQLGFLCFKLEIFTLLQVA